MALKSRRSFLTEGSIHLLAGAGLLKGCTNFRESGNDHSYSGLYSGEHRELSIRKGWNSYLLVKTGDVINAAGDRFGDCSDFTAFSNMDRRKDFLWVNHEYINQHVRYGKNIKPQDKTRTMVDLERYDVGGSYVELARDPMGRYQVLRSSNAAFRVTAETPMQMTGPAGKGRVVEGMIGNCCGGSTPWGTILTCEENTDDFYSLDKDVFGWIKYYPRPPLDYGWVVEIDPVSRVARKHTALGRFAHEGATVAIAKSGHVVVYMADDKEGEHLYKFISSKTLKNHKTEDADLLTEGTLYVANLEEGRWEELSPRNPKLRKKESQTGKPHWTLAAILENPRDAAKNVGATPLARPEGIAIRKNGDILVSLTQHLAKDDLYGSILRIVEDDADFCSLTFKKSTWMAGGPASGFACPDNICTDTQDQVWITTDVSWKLLGTDGFGFVKRNILFRAVESNGRPPEVEVFAVAPQGAEFTGPSFHPNGKELFLSVQHPAEGSFEDGRKLSSHWPNRVGELPQSGVVVMEMI